MSRIMVSAGHGGRDRGSVGYGHAEADLALELRDLVRPLLERRGHTVTTDGRTGESLPLRTAIPIAAAADVALEIHFNSRQADATGVECFAYAPHTSNRPLCQLLAGGVARAIGLRTRGGQGGYKPDTETQHGARGLGFCRRGRGVLLEVCFMNQHDLSRFLPRKAEVAEAIASALDQHVGGAARPTSFWNQRPSRIQSFGLIEWQRTPRAPQRRVAG